MAGTCVVSQSVSADGWLIVSLSGEISFEEYESVRSNLYGIVEREPANAIEIDLRNLIWIDSTGVTLLTALYKRFGGRIRVLVAPHSQPAQIIKRLMAPLLQ